MTRYIIIGTGAIGSTLGGYLTRAGIDTVLVARGEHATVLQRDGLRIINADEDVRVPVTAVISPEQIELRPDDVLVATTKTHQLQDALVAWADRPVAGGGTAGERLPILTALNGLEADRIALRYFQRVASVTIWLPATHVVPGEVIPRSLPPAVGVFHVGRYPAELTDDTDRAVLAKIAADWKSAGFGFHHYDDVTPWKYNKLISNINNAFPALVGSNGDTKPLAAAAKAEAVEILEAAGYEFVSFEVTEGLRKSEGPKPQPVPGFEGRLGGSTWQSLQRGTGNAESDFLNGEIVRIAHSLGRTAPINAAIARLVRQAVREGWSPGNISADELAEQLGLVPTT